jgi:hypothetical protein
MGMPGALEKAIACSFRRSYGLRARVRLGAICAYFRHVVFGLEAVSALGAKGVFEKIFRVLSGDPDFEYALIDCTIIKVHRHGTGAKGGLRVKP